MNTVSGFVDLLIVLNESPFLFSSPLLVPTSAPNNLTATATDSTSILVHWDAPVMQDWNGVLLNYVVYYYGVEQDSVVRTVPITIQGSNHSDQEYLIVGLEEYTHYRIVVTSVTSIGAGTAANTTVRTEQAG